MSLMCSVGSQAQQTLHLLSGRVSEKIESTVPTRDIVELEDGYMVTYSLDKALVQPDKLYSGTMFWKMDGFEQSQNPRTPSTLVRYDSFAIPSGYSVKVEATDSSYCDYAYELTPARPPLQNSNHEKYSKQNVPPITPYEGFYPLATVELSGIQSYRGHHICQIAVSPIKYNYKSRTIRAYTSITYKVSLTPTLKREGTGISIPKSISSEDNFFGNTVIGGTGTIANNKKKTVMNQTDVRDYLILSTNSYSTAANRFAEWKRLMGFNVHVVLRDDWTTTSVKNEVNNAYDNMESLYYLLIIGDQDDVPAQQSSLIKNHVTDFHYGCVDGDYIPDIYCGRISVSSSEEALSVIDKIVNFERTPPTSPSFYNSALHCAYFQDDDKDHYEDRRYTQTSEEIRSYVMTMGKTIQRVYMTPSSVTPQYWSNFYSNGEAIPDELKKPGFVWNGSYSHITDAINNGVFYVLHRDHGGVTEWWRPNYSQQNIPALTNGNLLPVVFSINCLTGKFDENCFAETFLRKSNGGCVAIYGASEISYSGYNEALASGMFDAIWPDPGLSIHIPNQNNSFSSTPSPTYELGQILCQGLVRLAETYGFTNKYTKYTSEIFHCFGDPSMRINTTVPTAYDSVSIVRDGNTISIALGEDDIARITAYDPISGEIQSRLSNWGTIYTAHPSETAICISGHNRIPYVEIPDVKYFQNTNITGVINETHDVIKMGNHVTSTIEAGDVTTSNADITLKAKEIILDSGTEISIGSTLKTINP